MRRIVISKHKIKQLLIDMIIKEGYASELLSGTEPDIFILIDKYQRAHVTMPNVKGGLD